MIIDRPERETQNLIVSLFKNEITSQKHDNSISFAEQVKFSKKRLAKSDVMREVLPEKARLI